jgi:hypothetical protein
MTHPLVQRDRGPARVVFGEWADQRMRSWSTFIAVAAVCAGAMSAHGAPAPEAGGPTKYRGAASLFATSTDEGGLDLGASAAAYRPVSQAVDVGLEVNFLDIDPAALGYVTVEPDPRQRGRPEWAIGPSLAVRAWPDRAHRVFYGVASGGLSYLQRQGFSNEGDWVPVVSGGLGLRAPGPVVSIGLEGRMQVLFDGAEPLGRDLHVLTVAALVHVP